MVGEMPSTEESCQHLVPCTKPGAPHESGHRLCRQTSIHIFSCVAAQTRRKVDPKNVYLNVDSQVGSVADRTIGLSVR